VAALIKLLGNMMTVTALEVLGEVVTALRKRGQDPRDLRAPLSPYPTCAVLAHYGTISSMPASSAATNPERGPAEPDVTAREPGDQTIADNAHRRHRDRRLLCLASASRTSLSASGIINPGA
jgi:hypothetical protein